MSKTTLSKPVDWAAVIPELIEESRTPFFDGPCTSIKIGNGPYKGKRLHIPLIFDKKQRERICQTLKEIWSKWPQDKYPPWDGPEVPYHCLPEGHWNLLGPPCAPYPMTRTPNPPFTGPHTALFNAGGYFNGWYLHVPRYLAPDEMNRAERCLSNACQKPWSWGSSYGANPVTALVKNNANKLDVYAAQKDMAKFFESEIRVDFAAQTDPYRIWVKTPIWLERKAPAPKPQRVPIEAAERPAPEPAKKGLTPKPVVDSGAKGLEHLDPKPAKVYVPKTVTNPVTKPAKAPPRPPSPRDNNCSDSDSSDDFVLVPRPNDPYDEYIPPPTGEEQGIWRRASERLSSLEALRKAEPDNSEYKALGRPGDWLGLKHRDEYSESGSSDSGNEQPMAFRSPPPDYVGKNLMKEARRMMQWVESNTDEVSSPSEEEETGPADNTNLEEDQEPGDEPESEKDMGSGHDTKPGEDMGPGDQKETEEAKEWGDHEESEEAKEPAEPTEPGEETGREQAEHEEEIKPGERAREVVSLTGKESAALGVDAGPAEDAAHDSDATHADDTGPVVYMQAIASEGALPRWIFPDPLAKTVIHTGGTDAAEPQVSAQSRVRPSVLDTRSSPVEEAGPLAHEVPSRTQAKRPQRVDTNNGTNSSQYVRSQGRTSPPETVEKGETPNTGTTDTGKHRVASQASETTTPAGGRSSPNLRESPSHITNAPVLSGAGKSRGVKAKPSTVRKFKDFRHSEKWLDVLKNKPPKSTLEDRSPRPVLEATSEPLEPTVGEVIQIVYCALQKALHTGWEHLRWSLRELWRILGLLLYAVSSARLEFQRRPFWNHRRIGRIGVWALATGVSSYIRSRHSLTDIAPDDIQRMCDLAHRRLLFPGGLADPVSLLFEMSPSLILSILQDDVVLLANWAVWRLLPLLLEDSGNRNRRSRLPAWRVFCRLLEALVIFLVWIYGVRWGAWLAILHHCPPLPPQKRITRPTYYM